jgi:hypothetical protein
LNELSVLSGTRLAWLVSIRRPPPYALPFAESDLRPRVRNRERERGRERGVLNLERKKFRGNVKIEKWKKKIENVEDERR